MDDELQLCLDDMKEIYDRDPVLQFVDSILSSGFMTI